MTEPCPDWLDPAPFRAHVRALIGETGLSWRLLAAHAGVAPRVVYALLHGRRSGALRRIHVSVARALVATSTESIAAAETDRTDARIPRQLVQDLLRLGYPSTTLTRHLSDDDLGQLADHHLAYCRSATAIRAAACYDLLTSPMAAGQRVAPSEAAEPTVSCGQHPGRLDRKRATGSPWRTGYSSSIAAPSKPC